MNVLVVFSSSEIGGAERSLTRMLNINQDDTLKYQSSTFATQGNWSDWANELGLSTICFNNNLFNLISFIRKNNIDVVYIIGFRLAVYLRFFKFLLNKTKLVQGIRWNPASNSKLDKYFSIIEKYFSHYLDGFICNSNAAKKTLENIGIKNNKIAVIYNGLKNIPQQFIKKDSSKVLTIANLAIRKGYIEYLNVIKKVLVELPNTQFVFIGRDDLNGRVQKEIKKQALENNIIYLGFQKDVNEFLEEASIFVLPSLYGEGCPTSILEAFSYKLPVIAYDIDGISELVTNNKDGILYQVVDEESMSEGIIYLLTNKAKNIEFGNYGLQKVKYKFTMNIMIKQHNDFFKYI